MDGQIFRVLKKICLFLFAGDIFVHAIVGASIINGMLAGRSAWVPCCCSSF